MPEYRRDPINGRWVVIAEERANRPHLFDASSESCPFCAGNESNTPPEIDAFRSGGTADDATWRVRVVPNRYPAIVPHDDFPNHHRFLSQFGAVLNVDAPLSVFEEPFYTPIPGVGQHEVIIDTPRHVLSLTELTEGEAIEWLQMLRRRWLHWTQSKRFAYITIFKNVGRTAGASLPHSHSQLMAMPLIPPPIQRELQRAISFRNETRRCYWCEHIKHEIANGSRVVETTQHFAVLCPYVSRFPYELAVFPRKHISHFDHFSDRDITELATLLRRCVGRWRRVVEHSKRGIPDYNIILKSGPLIYKGPLDTSDTSDSAVWLRDVDYAYEQAYHLHWSLIPALAKPAGFEWGCGLHINSVSPERAADILRG